MIKYVWLGSLGPYIYDSEAPLNDPRGLMAPGTFESGITSTGQIQVVDQPGTDLEIVRLEDLKAFVPTGLICMWSGSIASIPAGWRLCDGTGGTPNLQDRFILGASGTTVPGTTGGNNTYDTGPDLGAGQAVQSGSGVTVAAHTHLHNIADSRPSFYALAYIMKVAA